MYLQNYFSLLIMGLGRFTKEKKSRDTASLSAHLCGQELVNCKYYVSSWLIPSKVSLLCRHVLSEPICPSFANLDYNKASCFAQQHTVQ